MTVYMIHFDDNIGRPTLILMTLNVNTLLPDSCWLRRFLLHGARNCVFGKAKQLCCLVSKLISSSSRYIVISRGYFWYHRGWLQGLHPRQRQNYFVCRHVQSTVGYNSIFIVHKVLLPLCKTAVAQTSLPISPSAKVEFTATHTLQGVFLMLAWAIFLLTLSVLCVGFLV